MLASFPGLSLGLGTRLPTYTYMYINTIFVVREFWFTYQQIQVEVVPAEDAYAQDGSVTAGMGRSDLLEPITRCFF